MEGFGCGSYTISINLPLNRENDDMMKSVREELKKIRAMVEDFYKKSKQEERHGRELFTGVPNIDVKWEYHARNARIESPVNYSSPGGDAVS